MLPKKLQEKLQERTKSNSYRSLKTENGLIDFSSNDYLGFASSEKLQEDTISILSEFDPRNGAGGSRLLTGNHNLYDIAEKEVCNFHKAASALIFNSGYDANIGLISSVSQRGDLIFYDELIHASLRDGIKLSSATAYKFKHNDIKQLQELIDRNYKVGAVVYVVTESVFSMDGDSPDVEALTAYCTKNKYRLILDEAHAVGVIGSGRGIACDLGLEDQIFARVVTFGKAIGAHGAAILGSKDLRNFLINFARSFIYTTALPPHSVANIIAAYRLLKKAIEPTNNSIITVLHSKIAILLKYVERNELSNFFIESNSAIHCCLISGNDRVKKVSEMLENEGFDVRPIVSPTVPQGTERLRICLHAFNSEKEIEKMLSLLAKHLQS